ncbi:GIY-YIG nuclease family protein [Aneurinibacillus sp. REN35]|uniref:GIY-YIG nuclease family protein n=1 Tax=Aneurinibacillus sp. REN35 TaxID=3237286 RepID=UPI003527C45E
MNEQKRAEIKREYKQKSAPMGVYQIKNLTTGKIFIGSCPNLEAMKNRQWFELNMGSHQNTELMADWKTYGEDNFSFEILEQLKPAEGTAGNQQHPRVYRKQLQEMEEKWLQKLTPYGDKGYHSI